MSITATLSRFGRILKKVDMKRLKNLEKVIKAIKQEAEGKDF